MRYFWTASAFVAHLTPRVIAVFETTYHSSPLAIQPFTILARSADYDPDNTTLFLACPVGIDVAQPGPAIYDSQGALVWADPTLGTCSNLNFQTYAGDEYLTMWVGVGSAGTGQQTGDGLDLTSVGGPKDGWYLNAIIQEIDIATGAVIFNWTSIDHIPFSESYNNITQTGQGNSSFPWDPVHINSIDKNGAGDYLISARHTQTIYKVDGKNGSIIWRLGGKTSDFTPVGNDTQFFWQHHARWHADETQISLFDDGAAFIDTTVIVNEPVASGKFLAIDEKAMTVSLAARFLPSPSTIYAVVLSQPSKQLTTLYGSTVVTGYGVNPWVVVQDYETGAVLLSATIGPNDPTLPFGAVTNYRAYQLSTHQFVGRPTEPPSVAVEGADVYVSWNGATHVAAWVLLTGTSAQNVTTEVARVGKAEFETRLDGSRSEAFIAVAALAANGTTLGTSAVYSTSDGSVERR
ncbi:ASST-domain-containing protein [Mycena albidolilacea]|uniref:ASST-domain-containing protein n=1 Tax=Mycena albidolilacea TaxID=1033008 RepID=A0AAD7EID9_9AGAR|nr:ASST-domain-containing protein [Mycena albidolilacea]